MITNAAEKARIESLIAAAPNDGKNVSGHLMVVNGARSDAGHGREDIRGIYGSGIAIHEAEDGWKGWYSNDVLQHEEGGWRR